MYFFTNYSFGTPGRSWSLCRKAARPGSAGGFGGGSARPSAASRAQRSMPQLQRETSAPRTMSATEKCSPTNNMYYYGRNATNR